MSLLDGPGVGPGHRVEGWEDRVREAWEAPGAGWAPSLGLLFPARGLPGGPAPRWECRCPGDSPCQRVADHTHQEQASFHPRPRGTALGPKGGVSFWLQSRPADKCPEVRGGGSEGPCHTCLMRGCLLQGLGAHLPREGLLGAWSSVRPWRSLWGQGTRGLAGGSGQV